MDNDFCAFGSLLSVLRFVRRLHSPMSAASLVVNVFNSGHVAIRSKQMSTLHKNNQQNHL